MGTMSTLSGLFTKIEQAVLEYYSKAGVDVHIWCPDLISVPGRANQGDKCLSMHIMVHLRAEIKVDCSPVIAMRPY